MIEVVRCATGRYEICSKNNPKTQNKILLGTNKQGNLPGEYWQLDFTELPRKEGWKYWLVLIDTCIGWPEAFPCTLTEREKW